MRVTIPDEILESYQAFADRQGVTLEHVLTAQLKRFSALEPGKKAIVVQPDIVLALDKRLGPLPLRDGQDLVDRVTRLASIDFEHIDLELTMQQKEELAHRSRRSGRSVEFLVNEVADKLKQDLFWRMGGGEAKSA